MKDKKEKYLPLGTVVLLKGATTRFMIVGFCVIKEGNEEKMWDYAGYVYPYGLLNAKETYFFNHDEIEETCYLGLEDDEEEKKFKKRLKEEEKNFTENE